MSDRKFNELYKNGDLPWKNSEIDLQPWLQKIEIYSGHALDLGCGTGDISGWLTDHGFTVEGLDISPNAIKIAKSEFEKPTFVVWDLNDLSLYSFLYEKYELIIDAKTFRSINNKDIYLEVIAKKLSGVFVLQIFTSHKEKPFLAMEENEIKKYTEPFFDLIDTNSFPTDRYVMMEYFFKRKRTAQ